jgi:hypothetical protein
MNQKVYLVNASLRWLNDVVGVYLFQVSLLLIGQQGFGKFLQVSGLASHWLDNCANFPPTLEEMNQYLQRQLLLVQYTQQANPLLFTHNCTPLVISRNDKNKKLTIIKPT